MDTTFFFIRTAAVLYLVLTLALLAVFAYIVFLVIKALRTYINTREIREHKQILKKSLGELLRENRIRCKMTQEFVAEALGVSRQAVSKWENGTTDPSTSNLIAIARLYGVCADELLRSVSSGRTAEQEDRQEKGEEQP